MINQFLYTGRHNKKVLKGWHWKSIQAIYFKKPGIMSVSRNVNFPILIIQMMY